MFSIAMRMSETTGPPFCESPVWSSPAVCLPSRSAAMPRICATVTTPVPPMPIILTTPSAGIDGSGSSTASGGASCLAFLPGTTVRKEGQSPSRQEKSLLHEAWWIWVLRPNSVSVGTTDRQLDLRPQSPHPSQTRSRSEEHTSELQSHSDLVCRLLLEKKK